MLYIYLELNKRNCFGLQIVIQSRKARGLNTVKAVLDRRQGSSFLSLVLPGLFTCQCHFLLSFMFRQQESSLPPRQGEDRLSLRGEATKAGIPGSSERKQEAQEQWDASQLYLRGRYSPRNFFILKGNTCSRRWSHFHSTLIFKMYSNITKGKMIFCLSEQYVVKCKSFQKRNPP